jgi:hypothetical protein
MKFGNTPESTAFTDDTRIPLLDTYLRQTIFKQQHPISQIDPETLPPGGYKDWLNHALSDLHPDEARLMRDHGFSLQDIYALRSHNAGKAFMPPK